MARGGSAVGRALSLLLALGLLAAAAASSGDESLDYWRCTRACEASGCTDAPGRPAAERRCSPLCAAARQAGRQPPAPAPLALRLWRWDCAADCRYLCMWQREESKAAAAAGPAAAAAAEKYHGKWPFRRLLGMQEPASVAFSLLNMAAQLRCLACYARLLRRSGAAAAPKHRVEAQTVDGGSASSAVAAAADRAAAWACRRLWPAYFLLSAAAWLASAAFHGRDTRLTERLDYYLAGALVAFTTFLSAARTLRLSGRPRMLAGALVAAATARHLYRMQFVHFDYGLHVRVCIAAGLAQAALWLLWAAARAPRGHAGRPWLLAFVALIHASMLFEVLDFAPFRAVLDAHAVWHACTVPLAFVWYRFVAEDATFGAGAGGPGGAGKPD